MRWSARAALAGLGALLALVWAAPLVTALLGVDPYTPDPSAVYAGPSAAHLLGTDELGRDVLARLLYGGRLSLTLAIGATAIAVGIGAVIGLVAGWAGGLADRALMGLTNAMLAVPRLPLMLILAAIDPRAVGLELGAAASVVEVLVIVVAFGWMSAARLARASALELRGRDFVTAARALGASELHILRVHVAPHAASPLLVLAVVEAAEVVVYESVLSFLGLGVQPPVPSWGTMLAGGFTYLHTAPQLLVLPGLLTFAAVAVLGLAADGLGARLARRT
ncbi:ABC transporter permease [Myxococcota bacterium]|nr:ABC transporter permease [Myxococcota bacterium]